MCAQRNVGVVVVRECRVTVCLLMSVDTVRRPIREVKSWRTTPGVKRNGK